MIRIATVDPDSLYLRAKQAIEAQKDLLQDERDFFFLALEIARHAPVTRPHRPQHVFFTITGQPTKLNKDRAIEYLKANKGKAQIIDHTPVGLLLESMSEKLFDTAYDVAYAVWHLASARYAAAAVGDVHVEWAGLKEHSTSEQIEMPVLLANAAVKTINGIDKNIALAKLLAHYPDRRKALALRYHLYQQNQYKDPACLEQYRDTLHQVMQKFPEVMKAANKMADALGVEKPLQYIPRNRRLGKRHALTR